MTHDVTVTDAQKLTTDGRTEPEPLSTGAVACQASQSGTRRRAVLGLAAVTGVVCAGCSTYGANSSSASQADQQQTNPPAADGGASPSASGGGSTGASSGSNAPSAVALAQTSAVPVGGGTILSDRQIVLTQPTAGTFKAFTAVCTHQGCTVSSIDNGLIICPCHGSRFHLADGSVANGPAQRALASIAVKVTGDVITLA